MGVRPGGVSEFELGLTKRSWERGATRTTASKNQIEAHAFVLLAHSQLADRAWPLRRAHSRHTEARAPVRA